MEEGEPTVHNAPAAARWGVRIFVTLFTIPFFVIGFGVLFSGVRFGGVGWFGSMLGLPFIAVPSLMLIGIWLGTGRTVPLPRPHGTPQPRDSVRLLNCEYCGRARQPSDPRCSTCGA